LKTNPYQVNFIQKPPPKSCRNVQDSTKSMRLDVGIENVSSNCSRHLTCVCFINLLISYGT